MSPLLSPSYGYLTISSSSLLGCTQSAPKNPGRYSLCSLVRPRVQSTDKVYKRTYLVDMAGKLRYTDDDKRRIDHKVAGAVSCWAKSATPQLPWPAPPAVLVSPPVKLRAKVREDAWLAHIAQRGSLLACVRMMRWAVHRCNICS